MTAADLQPLLVVLEQAQRERDAALAQQQRADAALDAAQRQHGQLVEYRRDYEQRWAERFAGQGHVELLHSYHGFVGRLSQAVDQQARAVETAEVQLAASRQLLQQLELRVASVRKLIERRLEEIEKLGERREQRMLDEMATRAAWNRLAAATTRF